jgi:diketogulonate reductase-like aldo/keto reductase
MPARGRAAERALAALRLGIDLGLTHVDTAEMYSNGATERLVARLIGERRHEVFLASKVLPSNASYTGTLAACERSLRRLGTDHIDLFMIHWPGPYPIAETMQAMERLVDQGKIRYIGVSNFDVDELRDAQQALTRHRLVANQVLYWVGNRGIEHRLLPYCERTGITVVAYSPFGSGRFPSLRSPGGGVLAGIARRHGNTARQVALAFLIRRPQVVTIPKAAHEEHVRENAAAADIDLSPRDIAAIDRAFPPPPPDAPLGMI